MALKDRLTKKATTPEEATPERAYRIGAQKIFRVDSASLDLVVTGRVQGTLKVGDMMTLTNLGDDDSTPKQVAVYAIETAERERIFEATDMPVIIWLEDALQLGIKKGSVLHSENVPVEDIYQTYVSNLGDIYIGDQDGVLTDADKQVVSLGDLTEIWRIYAWYCNVNAEEQTDVERQVNMDRMEQLVLFTRDKLLASPLAVVYSPATNEPYLFSQTMQREDGSYFCSAPMMFVAPVAFEERLKSRFSDTEKYDIRRVSAEDMQQVFTDAFYLNGVTGVHLMSEQTSIASQGIIAPPTYDGVPEEEIPVTNPDVMRWLLLLGQLGTPTTDEDRLNHQLYYRFMALEMPKARFLTPIKDVREGEPAQLTMGTDANFKIAILEGLDDKDAIAFYTDWKRLREVYGQEWKALVQNLHQVTKAYDVVVNPTPFPAVGCYITDTTFEQMKQMV